MFIQRPIKMVCR